MQQSNLEPILVATLLLAHLAIPSQLLEALGLDAIGDGLGREEAPVLAHLFLLRFFAYGKVSENEKRSL